MKKIGTKVAISTFIKIKKIEGKDTDGKDLF
jgi:hypothetical protein